MAFQMNSNEEILKRHIIRKLKSEGYPSTADLMELFKLKILEDTPNNADKVAFMIPGEYIIAVNPKINDDQLSFIIRHEIGHELYNHGEKMFQKLGDLLNDPNRHYIANAAMDSDLSQKLYSSKDYAIAKNIILADQKIAGFVLELDHPEWMGLSVEELDDKFAELYNYSEEKKDDMINQLSDEFVKSYNDTIKALVAKMPKANISNKMQIGQ